MAAETIVLDPSEVASGRTELSLTSGWIDVSIDGVDWGDAEIASYVAEAERGDIPVDYRLPPRTITIPFRMKTSGGTTFAQARTKLQQKVGTLQREGGHLKRITGQGGTLFMDITNASLSLPGDWWQAQKDVQKDGLLTLEAIPDFYEAETQLGDHTETSAAELRFVETNISGDYPARVRIVVDEDDGDTQLGLFWCARSRYYDSATTAALAYEAESQGIESPSRAIALTGASGGTVVNNGTISSNWQAIWNTSTGGTTYLTHQGNYRVRARVHSTAGTAVQTRFVWDVNDMVNPVENDEVRLSGHSNFFIVDYGEVRLQPTPVGTHRWQGQIQARGNAGTESFSVDRVWFQNLDDTAGLVTAATPISDGLTSYSARSEFTTESGTITGDSLHTGGVWTAITNSDTTDFSESGDVCTRTAVSDTGTAVFASGRGLYASTPTTLTNTVVQCDLKSSPVVGGHYFGVLARVDNAASDMLHVFIQSSTGVLAIQRIIAGNIQQLNAVTIAPLGNDVVYRMRVHVSSLGVVSVYFGPSSNPPLLLTATDSELATGGALASGTVGIVDTHGLSTAATRTFSNFAAWVPPTDAVAFASQSVQLTTQGIFREDAGGTAYGPVSNVYGDLPRLPVAGLDGRSTEIMVKMSRGDFGSLPDSGIDDLSARVNYSPSWLFAPD